MLKNKIVRITDKTRRLKREEVSSKMGVRKSFSNGFKIKIIKR